MKRSWEVTKEVLYWTAVVAVLLLFCPYWIAKYVYRTVTGKNRRMRGFLLDEEDGR